MFWPAYMAFTGGVVLICYSRNNASLILYAHQESKVGKPSKINKENSKAKWTGLSLPIVSKGVYTALQKVAPWGGNCLSSKSGRALRFKPVFLRNA